jgi:hypothetical protein
VTKLLDRALAALKALPEAEQDALAVALLAFAESDRPPLALDEETRAAVLQGLQQAARGEFASDPEMDALWRRHGL